VIIGLNDPLFDALVVARGLHFAALYYVVGGSFFWLVVAPSWAPAAFPSSFSSTRIGLRYATSIAAASGVAWLCLTIVNVTGDAASLADRQTLQDFFLATPFGPVEALRLAGFALLVGGSFFAEDRRSLRLLALVGAALLFSQAWLGHSAEGTTRLAAAAMIGTYGLHVLAGALWLGPLLPLGLCLRDIAQGRASPAEGLAPLLSYSGLAVGAVFVVLLSGVANTLFHSGFDANDLSRSQYGLVLGVKLVGVAGLLGLGGLNRWVLLPRLYRLNARVALNRLILSLFLDLALGVGVLVLAAVLGITPPPR
jgi:putative copper resistance protein D